MERMTNSELYLNRAVCGIFGLNNWIFFYLLVHLIVLDDGYHNVTS